MPNDVCTCVTCARIFKQSVEATQARNRIGLGLPYRPARLHRVGGIDSLESILGLLKSLKILALCTELAVFSVWALIHAVAGQKVGYGLCIPDACTNQDVR
jgi:hypothetical protein